MKTLVPILFNIRSVHNVGSILRTCDGFGIQEIVCVGYTPHLSKGLPHERLRLAEMLHKTALGAEQTVKTSYFPDLPAAIQYFRQQNFKILALEQAENSENLVDFIPPEENAVIIFGEEVKGIPQEYLALCDCTIEIPMRGQKESFNVSVAAGIALYELTKSF